jgi:hypothetical protein
VEQRAVWAVLQDSGEPVGSEEPLAADLSEDLACQARVDLQQVTPVEVLADLHPAMEGVDLVEPVARQRVIVEADRAVLQPVTAAGAAVVLAVLPLGIAVADRVGLQPVTVAVAVVAVLLPVAIREPSFCPRVRSGLQVDRVQEPWDYAAVLRDLLDQALAWPDLEVELVWI